MKLTAFLVLVVLSFVPRIDARDYINVDSSVYLDGDLVFFGGTDRCAYSYSDTVYVGMWVENYSTEAIILNPIFFCDGAIMSETWCPPPGTEFDCVTVRSVRQSCSQSDPPFPSVRIIAPGKHILWELAVEPFHDFTIPLNWRFETAETEIASPWQPPYFTLTVPYKRQDTTSIRSSTWTALKQLYR